MCLILQFLNLALFGRTWMRPLASRSNMLHWNPITFFDLWSISHIMPQTCTNNFLAVSMWCAVQLTLTFSVNDFWHCTSHRSHFFLVCRTGQISLSQPRTCLLLHQFLLEALLKGFPVLVNISCQLYSSGCRIHCPTFISHLSWYHVLMRHAHRSPESSNNFIALCTFTHKHSVT